MNALFYRLQALRADKRAVTALEYGIIASALGIVLLVVFQKLSTPISQALTNVGTSI